MKVSCIHRGIPFSTGGGHLTRHEAVCLQEQENRCLAEEERDRLAQVLRGMRIVIHSDLY